MNKLKIFAVIMLTLVLPIDKASFITYKWSPRTVGNSLRTTVVIFVEVAKGGYIGSGVIVSKEGRILTAAHLFTEQYKSITVVTTSMNEFKARVVAINRRSDLALIEPVTSAESFPYCTVQSSDYLFIGEDILVIGHPYGEYWTVTKGIISQLRFSIWYMAKMIETDATVRPGNSGGPVFNTKGELIGIISAMKINPLGQPTGIGIAISVKEIHKFLKGAIMYPSIQIRRERIGDVK